MSELKDLIENEISSLKNLMEDEGLFKYGLIHTILAINKTLSSIYEIMYNNMPVEYLDTEVSNLYSLICDLNLFINNLETGLTIADRTVILWHRHVLRKITCKIIQAIED